VTLLDAALAEASGPGFAPGSTAAKIRRRLWALCDRLVVPGPAFDYEAIAAYYDTLYAAAHSELHALCTTTPPWWRLLSSRVLRFLDTWAIRCASALGVGGILTFDAHRARLACAGGSGAPEGERLAQVGPPRPGASGVPRFAAWTAHHAAGGRGFTHADYWGRIYGRVHSARLPQGYARLDGVPWWADARHADIVMPEGLGTAEAACLEFMEMHAQRLGHASSQAHVAQERGVLDAFGAITLIPYYPREGPASGGPMTRSDLFVLSRVLGCPRAFQLRMAVASAPAMPILLRVLTHIDDTTRAGDPSFEAAGHPSVSPQVD
jgi:hypothetical protein